MGQKKTFDTLQAKLNEHVEFTPTRYKVGVNHTYRPAATRKPGSIEIVCGTFQMKSAENWDNELTQSAHLRNSRLVLYAKMLAVMHSMYCEELIEQL